MIYEQNNTKPAPELFVYFDMDGVLVNFNEKDSRTRPFLIPGSHYFRRQPPDTKAVDLMRCLSEFPKVKTVVLTRLMEKLEPGLANEHALDKKLWCLDHALTPDFDRETPEMPFICLYDTGDKTSVLNSLPPNENRRRHVLIDDDPVNLISWTDAGGAAFQYVQYRRHVKHFGDVRLKWDMRVADMVPHIIDCMR